MNRAAAALGFALRRGALGLRRRPVASAWAAIAVAAALFALGAARLVERNLVALVDRWPGDVDMIVYLDDGATPARARAIATALAALPAVERVEQVAASEALDHLRVALGDEAALLDGVEPGMVPASIEVALAAGVEDVAAGHPVIARLRATPGVEDVEFVSDWVDRAGALGAGLRRGTAAAVAIAALLAAVLIAASVRLATAGRRRDARLLELLGATAAFRRGPAVVHGVVVGLLGGLAACVALALGYREVADPIVGALGAAIDGLRIDFLPGAELVALAGLGVALGAIGGLLASGGPAREPTGA